MRVAVRKHLVDSDDSGAFAVLYAVLVVVLLGMAALVADFANVRQERRLGRSAADSAVIGAASFLNPGSAGGLDPKAACLRAWDYIEIGLKVSRSSAAPTGVCSKMPTPAAAVTKCSVADPTEIDDDRVIGNRTIRVAWPIPASGGSGFLNPDLAPGSASQSFAPLRDGLQSGVGAGCDRIGVAVFENLNLALGGSFGVSSTSTQVHSVARFASLPGKDEFTYPLVILDKTVCDALVANGTGANIVVTNGGTGFANVPGRIAVDSDGSGKGCGSKAPSIVTVSGGTFVQTQDGADATTVPQDKGGIEFYSSVNRVKSGTNIPCTPNNSVAPTNTPCTGQDFKRATRVTRTPFDVKFGAAIAQLDTALAPVTLATGWTNLTGAACNSDYTATSGNQFFINCPAEKPTFKLTSKWSFPPGATVIVNGDLTTGSGGCFITNRNPSWPIAGLCDGSFTLPPSSTYTSSAVLRVKGNVDASGGGSLVLPGTLLHLPTAGTAITATSFGVVTWTAPYYADKDSAKAACSVSLAAGGMPAGACFRNLALWTDSTSLNNVQGGAVLTLEGTFFGGDAPVKVGGSGAINVTSSQFVALTLSNGGGKTLTFTPDPNRTTGVPIDGVALIR